MGPPKYPDLGPENRAARQVCYARPVRLPLLLACILLGSCDCADGNGPPASDAGPDGSDEDGGDAGRIPGRAVRVPAMVEADLGAITTVPVTIVAGTAAWATTLTAEAPRFVYIEGQPATVRPLSIDSVRLEAGQQKQYELRLQTLLTWDHTITLRVHGEAFVVPVRPSLLPPLIGVDGFGCDGPHVLAHGPDCGPCGPETTSQTCADTQPLAQCHPIGMQIPEGVDEEVARAACDSGAALPIQITHDVPASFWSLAVAPDALDTTELEWIAGVLELQLRTRAVAVPGLQTWWMQTCTDCANADGTRGPYDPANAIVFDGLQAMGGALAAVHGVPALELATAEQAFDLLCPCVAAGTPCDAASGPSQPACALDDALYTDELATAYGPLVAAIASRVAQGAHAAGTDTLVVSAPVDSPSRGLSPLTRVALGAGMADAIDALGVTAAPAPEPTWLDPVPDCTIDAPGCETAPPFEDWTALLPPEGGGDPVPTVVSAAETWRAFDLEVDPSEIGLALVFGGWDVPLWYSRIRAGFHGTSPREVIAAFRIGTLLTAMRVEGMSFAFPPAEPNAYELLVRTLSGTHPVRRDEQPADFEELVLRFLTRDGEDVLVAWNNAEAARVAFVAAEDLDYLEVTVTRVRADGPQLEITTETLASPDTQLSVMPLSEVVILRVDAEERLGFRWLQTIQY